MKRHVLAVTLLVACLAPPTSSALASPFNPWPTIFLGGGVPILGYGLVASIASAEVDRHRHGWHIHGYIAGGMNLTVGISAAVVASVANDDTGVSASMAVVSTLMGLFSISMGALNHDKPGPGNSFVVAPVSLRGPSSGAEVPGVALSGTF